MKPCNEDKVVRLKMAEHLHSIWSEWMREVIVEKGAVPRDGIPYGKEYALFHIFKIHRAKYESWKRDAYLPFDGLNAQKKAGFLAGAERIVEVLEEAAAVDWFGEGEEAPTRGSSCKEIALAKERDSLLNDITRALTRVEFIRDGVGDVLNSEYKQAVCEACAILRDSGKNYGDEVE